jgi:OPT family oligopeptide transporter
MGALIAHTFLFWGKDAFNSIKESRARTFKDRHQQAMMKYKEASWIWYAALLILSFIFGLIVVLKDNITLPWWGYIVALLVGSIIAPFSTIIYGMMGNGIATNQLMKMIGGSLIPGRPLANLYFLAWSHSTISQSLNLASDLKLGQYLKIPPRTMFTTQILGTVFGAFLNYAVMISIVNQQRDILTDSNGTFTWSGQLFQSLNTQATTWSLSSYLYTVDGKYFLIPMGILIGAAAVVLHKILCRVSCW